MTLPASGPLVLGLAGGGNSINSEFGYGNNLQSYLGAYYGKSGQLYRFPTPGNSISTNLFYSTFKITGGSQTFNSSGTFVVPVYNTITITTYGDQGGQSGQFGIQGCGTPYNTPSDPGQSSGVNTTFQGYVSSSSGAGGSGNSVPGSYGPVNSQTFTNPGQNGSGPPSGGSITVTVGPGGPGGQGGQNWAVYYHGWPFNSSFCDVVNRAATGAQGAHGVVTISWS